MSRRLCAVAMLLVPLAAAACDLSVSCQATGQYGIQVRIEDSLTTDPIADSAFAKASDMLDTAYVDTLRVAGLDIAGRPLWRAGVIDRTGRYAVFVSRPGYEDWAVSGVEVVNGNCGIIPIQLLARLTVDSTAALQRRGAAGRP
jgi:hypothetical protein